MLRRLSVLFLLLTSAISYGRDPADSLLATFYDKTISYYFSDSNYTREKKFNQVLLRTDFDTTLLPEKIGSVRFRYFSSKTNERVVLAKPLKRNKGRSIYSVGHTIIHPDTIDININGETVEQASKRLLVLAVWCGGTMGYIPDGRFVFDKASKSWNFINGREIMHQKAEALRRKFHLHQE